MLTIEQRAALKTAIQTDTTLNFLYTEGNLGGLADALNALVVPAIYVWRSSTPTADICDAITWANFTPTDTPDTTVIYTNRSLACQGKQFNLQTLLTGRESINTGKANLRTGLKDSLQNVPAGASGALLDAGWLAVKAAITRPATVLEKVFATGTGTLASPATLVVESPIDYTELIGL